jgi:hypothetical protein
MLITVSHVTFEPLDPASGLRVAAIIVAEGIEGRAQPIMVRFGDVEAHTVVGLAEGNGVRATFSELPNEGDTLEIGYLDEEISSTSFEFHNPPIA